MKNRHLSKVVAGQKFYEFRVKLKKKCDENSIELRVVDRFYPSSKLCNCCGFIKKDLKLSDRIYRCNCGYIEDRDINGFFDDKAAQSEEVAGWSESGIKKLKNCYMKNLADAGLIESTKTRVIRHALVNYRIEELLHSNGMDAYINAVKGV